VDIGERIEKTQVSTSFAHEEQAASACGPLPQAAYAHQGKIIP
jgi:hypothetical protein